MSEKTPSPPSVREMGDRIISNLARVQGYLDVLQSEIDDPEKLGPGTERDEWERLTQELSERLADLEKFLKSKNWESQT